MQQRSTGPTLAVVIALASLGACRSAGGPGAQPAPAAVHGPATPAESPIAAAHRAVGTDPGHVGAGTPLVAHAGMQLAAFAGGCFWGVEDVFRQVPGVVATAVGFTGGHTSNPSYEQVCTHTTGHAETVLVEFDPARVSYARLLEVFLRNHDPIDYEGAASGAGDQYRSEVFAFDEAQSAAARDAIAAEQARRGSTRIGTRVEPIGAFWRAEDYHQQYDERAGTHSCPVGVPAPGA